jgi:hypothetical protein
MNGSTNRIAVLGAVLMPLFRADIQAQAGALPPGTVTSLVR